VKQENREDPAKDLYAGYYWGLDFITISVNNEIVILTGHVRTYEKRRLIGEEVWNTPGVARVLNELQVTDPETAGRGRFQKRMSRKN
jgi:hypothetical protein